MPIGRLVRQVADKHQARARGLVLACGTCQGGGGGSVRTKQAEWLRSSLSPLAGIRARVRVVHTLAAACCVFALTFAPHPHRACSSARAPLRCRQHSPPPGPLSAKQVCTQRSWKRPYGVGLLVAGHDERGPHLYNTCPSGNYWEYKAYAMGARSQARLC
jgi:hypothetical protein